MNGVPIDYDALGILFNVAQGVGLGAVSLYTYVSNRRRATKEAIAAVEIKHDLDIKAVEAHLQVHGDRILRAEQQIAHLPDGDKIGEVHYRIDQLGQGVKGMEGQMKQMNHTLQLIQGHLLENRK
ncbi:MAG TPA: hypothetical protein VJ396_06940 [Acidiferrobacterales bacterium]|nr:hypothetical protein [Acidiferrobacterales bacterium]